MRNYVFFTSYPVRFTAAKPHQLLLHMPELGVPVSGTLGLLVKAVRAAILASEEADALLVQMIAGGYRSPRPTISELL